MRTKMGSPVVLVGVVVAASACQGRRAEIEAYARDMCACTDAECVKGVDVKHQTTLEARSSWIERHLLSKSAEVAMIQALERAERCADKLRVPTFTCGGIKGESCPSGYGCEGLDPTISDAQGTCVRIPGYVLKEGDSCIVPGEVACGPGLTCMTEQVGSITSIGHCVPGKPGIGSLAGGGYPSASVSASASVSK